MSYWQNKKRLLKDDMQGATESLHTTTGLKAGAEAATNTMQTIFKDPLTELVILVDESNAFNSLNREVALHNIKIACSSFTYILINTYRTSPRMIIMGGAEIQSIEGTTQGDNLVMSFYAIASIQIQQLLLISFHDVKQVWLAEDATGAGSLKSLKNWWTNVISEGGRFGYLLVRKSNRLL